MAFLQGFHLPEMGCKSVQWEKIGLSDPFIYGYLSRKAQVFHRFIGGRNVGATDHPHFFYRGRNGEY